MTFKERAQGALEELRDRFEQDWDLYTIVLIFILIFSYVGYKHYGCYGEADRAFLDRIDQANDYWRGRP